MRWHYVSRGELPNMENRDYVRCIVETPLQNGESFYIIADYERIKNGYSEFGWFNVEDRTEVECFSFNVEKWCPIEDILDLLNNNLLPGRYLVRQRRKYE